MTPPTLPSSSPRKFSPVQTNIQLTLSDHLPEEYSANEDRITSLNSQLEEAHAYKAYLERIAQASEICLDQDRQRGEDPVNPNLLPKMDNARGA